MDFRADKQALDVADQFMFGPAFLVSPVTAYQERSRSVYLPPAAAGMTSGPARRWRRQTIAAAAPYDAIRSTSGLARSSHRAGAAIRRREARGPGHALRLCRRGRRVHAVRG